MKITKLHPGGGHRESPCLMEAISMLEGEPFSMEPRCVDPVLAHFGWGLNDLAFDDPTVLLRYAPLFVGTAGDGREAERNRMLGEWAVEVAQPALHRARSVNPSVHASLLDAVHRVEHVLAGGRLRETPGMNLGDAVRGVLRFAVIWADSIGLERRCFDILDRLLASDTVPEDWSACPAESEPALALH